MATDLSQYDPIFQAAGQEWNVDPALLKAVAGQESGGSLNAVSPAGAQGLMQIMPDTQKYLGITDPKDPTQQIYGAAKYLDEGLNKEGSPEGALLYYHGGPGWRQAYGPESQAYVPAVTARYAALSQAQTSAAPPASSPTTAPSGASQGATPVIVGDSLASPGGLGGSGVVGAVPGAIRSSVAADARKGTYQGQNVVLSSGASNAPGDMTNVEGQLQLLQNGGAKGVTLLGVGPGIETKAPGTNDALQGLATKYGATFVPLPADQMSPDGVHPTARGYKALRTQLASATPITATDASPAPVTATGPGNAMASDDPLSLLPPAPKPTTGGSAASAATAAPDDPWSLLPPAPVPAGMVATTTAQAPTAETATIDPTTGAPMMTSGPPVAPGPAAPGDAAVTRIGQAAAEGWQSATMQTPAAYAENQKSLLGQYVTNPLVELGNLPFRALGAAGSAIGQGAYEAGNALDPRLGRDLFMLNQILPAGAMEHGFFSSPTPSLAAPEVNQLSPKFVSERTAPPREPGATDVDRIMQLIRHDDDEAAGKGPQTPVQPSATPTPQPAGAQVSPTSIVGLTPAEEAAYQATAEGKKLLEPQQPGIPDRNAYVPGVQPNLAEQEQTVNTARELKSLGVTSEQVSQTAKETAASNNDARQQYFESIAKSPVDVANAQAERDAQAQSDLAATWANKTDADASPVVDVANQIKASPDGRRPAVRNAIDSVTNELTDANGNLITDPEQLYGVRKHLDDLLSREGQRETPLSGRATANLQALKEQLDTTIEAAAPGFKQYLQNYSDASRNIDQMQVLQGHEAGLYDSQNRMTYNKVQTMMRNVVDSRNSPGLNPYKSITDDTMQKLWNLRDDLRRSAGAVELARTPGSDTAQNIFDMIKNVARSPEAQGALHAALGYTLGPAGNVGLAVGTRILQPILSARTAARQTQRGLEMLRPPNPLINPNAAP